MYMLFMAINKIDVDGFITGIFFNMIEDCLLISCGNERNSVFCSPYTVEVYFNIGHGRWFWAKARFVRVASLIPGINAGVIQPSLV